MKGRPNGSNLEFVIRLQVQAKESPMKTYYVGMDVHRATIALAVLNGTGKVVMESTIETGAERVRGFLQPLRGKANVTFEEGTPANWLHDIVPPMVRADVAFDSPDNKLLQSSNQH